MAKKLSQFDVAKDKWYAQPRLYVDTKSDDSLYEELKEFRSELSKTLPNDDAGLKRLLEDLYEEDDYAVLKRARARPKCPTTGEVASPLPPSAEAAGFLDLKLSLLREQIELLKSNLRVRKALYEKARTDVYYEMKRVKTELQDLYGWRKGEKPTVDAVKMELLRQMAALYREKRMNGLNHWKDLTFELRDLRALVSEYKSLKALVGMADLEGNGDVMAG